MRFETSFQLNVLESRKSTIRAISFHPSQPKCCMAYKFDIYGQLNHFIVSDEVTHLEHGVKNSLIASLKNGSFCVWDLNTGTLAAFHFPGKKSTVDKLPCTSFVLNSQKPIAYYVRSKQATVQTIDLFSDSSKSKIEYAHKKQVTSIATHPSKELLAVGSVDGIIRLWETDKNTSRLVMDGNDVSEDKKKKKTAPSPIVCLCFHSRKDVLVSGNQSGRIIFWSTAEKKVSKILGVAELEEWITSIDIHPVLPILICLTDKGILKGINFSSIFLNQKTRPVLAPDESIEFLYNSIKEDPYDMEDFHANIYFKMDPRTGDLCFYGKRYNYDMKYYYPLFGLYDNINPSSILPLSSNFNSPLSIFTQERDEFNFQVSDVCFLDPVSQFPTLLINNYNISKDETVVIKKSFETPVRCVRMLKQNSNLILFFETPSLESKYNYIKMDFANNEETKLSPGNDGCFLGDTNLYLILNENNVLLGNETIKLNDSITRVFSSPYDTAKILYYNSKIEGLGFANPLESKSKLQFDHSKVFYLRKTESIFNIYWHKEMMAILTTERITILNFDLQILESFEPQKKFPNQIHSAIWLGNILLFNTDSSVYSISPHSRTHAVCTLDHPTSVLCGVLADRLIFVCKRKNIEISFRYLRIVEPLILSIITSDTLSFEKKQNDLKLVTSRFDCRYISEKTFSLLEKNGFSVLASELLSESQYTFSWELRFRLAKSSLNFNYALTIIKNQCELDEIDESSEYYDYILELAKVSVDYGQFNIAAKCFDMIQDKWALFKIFIFDKNDKGLEWLSKKCSKIEELSIKECCQLFSESNQEGTTFDLNDEDSIQNWTMKVEDIKDYELGREITGMIKCNQEVVDPIRNDLATWLGYQQTVQVQEDSQLDFNQEFKEDPSDKKQKLDIPEVDPTLTRKSSNGTGEREDNEKSEKSNEKSEDKQEQARKAFQERSSSEDEDDDEETKKERKRKKILRSIKIKDRNEISETKEVSNLKFGIEEEEEDDSTEKDVPKIHIKKEEITPTSLGSETTPMPEQTPTPMTEPTPLPVKVNPTEAMKLGMENLEKGKYIDAYQAIDSAVKSLILDNSQILKKTNITLCVKYKLMIQTLINLQYLETNKASISDISNLSTFLSKIEIPIPKHKVICSTMAIRRNISANNFGVAAKILKELIPNAPQTAKEPLIVLYKQCETNNFKDESYDPNIIYCWKTFVKIQDSLKCNYCDAIFDSKSHKENSTCFYCCYGKIEKL